MFIHSKEVQQAVKLNRRENARQEFLAPAESAEIQAIEDAERLVSEEMQSLQRR